MLTMPRWEAEILVMRNVFPRFVAFAVPGKEAGFWGWFLGPRTGIPYLTTVRSLIRDYPEQEPGVYMEPRPEWHHWLVDDRLCYQRKGHVWKPAEDTFAQTLSIAMKYIAEFDGQG